MADVIMSSGAASKVVGPRPGKAACSFTEGVIEIVLRVLNGVFAILPTISGCLLLAYSITSDAVGSSSTATANSSSAANNSTPGPSGLIPCAAGALALIGGFFIIVWVIVMLILRFLNIGLLNLGSKYFLGTDVVVNIVFAVILIVGAAIAIVTAVDWQDVDDAVLGTAIAVIITGVISALFSILLAVYMIVYIVRDHNNEIIKYTIKDAITG